MKNLLFNILVFTGIILAVITKGCDKGVDNNNQSMYGTEQIFNKAQLDSAFIADTLNPNIDEWIKAVFIDYETNERVPKYMFTKENSNVAYTVTVKDSLFFYNKIEIKKE